MFRRGIGGFPWESVHKHKFINRKDTLWLRSGQAPVHQGKAEAEMGLTLHFVISDLAWPNLGNSKSEDVLSIQSSSPQLRRTGNQPCRDYRCHAGPF